MRELLPCMLLLVLAGTVSACLADPGKPVQLGQSFLRLDGPWKFHTGDDPRWAEPGFDDAAWEDVDLYAPPGANDGDSGVSPYTPGWTAKGHPGYQGYAWYRLHTTVLPPAGESLALLGPWAVDSVYQVYAGGKLLGGVGDFSGGTPTAYGFHYPRYFELPPDMAQGGTITLAIRVWLGPWAVARPALALGGAGGIHVAPAIGGQEAISAQYRLQWLRLFEGYVVDVVPALMYFLTALMALCVWRFDRADRVYPWLAVALLCTGIARGNQPFFFWWQIEPVQGFVIVTGILARPCALGAWMMAWHSWFRLDKPVWLPKAVAVLTGVTMAANLLSVPWMYHAAFPQLVASAVGYLALIAHWAFLLSYVLIAFMGIRRHGREAWYALPALLALGSVLFIGELVALGVPGTWFPFGVGLSLTECTGAILCVLLSGLLLRRLWSFAPRRHVTQLEPAS